jgi:serine/threonine protein kinase
MSHLSQSWHCDTPSSTSPGNSRSSRAQANRQGVQHTDEGLKAFGTQSSASGHATAIDFFVATLHDSNLPGPVILIDETAERVMIGRGSQFVVYRQRMAVPEFTQFSTRPVAVKVPKFSLDPRTPLKLAGSAAQKHLHDMYLEVLALTNPTIRGHPYVARLLAWSYDAYTMNNPLYLVMELADCSLRSFFESKDGKNVDMPLRYRFCQNIAAGVDVLHECGLIHGDLKPDNILIFKNGGHEYTAKVADFGLSIAEAVSDTKLGIGSIGGTRGWQAPEVEQGNAVPHHLWASTDNYSFGLLMWSVLLLDGLVPPTDGEKTRRTTAIEQSEAVEAELQFTVWKCVMDALSRLLQEDPSQRPDRLQTLFSDWQDLKPDMSVP